MFRKLWLMGTVAACLIGQAHAGSYQLDRLEPLEEQALSNYRAGFKFKDDFVINIGLNIRTSINGDTLFTNRIANLMIQNGRFISSRPNTQIPTTTIVQVGLENAVSLPNTQTVVPEPEAISTPTPSITPPATEVAATTESGSPSPAITTTLPAEPESVANPPVSQPTVASVSQVTVSQVVVPANVFDQAAINNIIQNTLDGTVVGFDTVIDIDAQVGSVIRQIERSNKLQQALQINLQ
ncbi:hypothetical protein VII00023_18389 [Vibrio ichthyoenteri ATCC 700023]|uniref:Uncharacterized protein n=1 Tax=Vibrio ichthyoenteri ATCC 700023 TaxID=870968 RepID=F9S0M2_9VIBR|nr:hypothetical protein [Vibrio ichthyoenteri]EGU43164.1 hypothetical protein VII00023_18389 [Vibrio ichthyoenteri ATCC 700023]